MRSMPRTLRAEGWMAGGLLAAGAAARLGAAHALAAWPVLAGRVLFYLVILFVLSALWDKVLAERVTPLAASLRPGGLAVYISITEWVTLSVVTIQNRLEDDIRRGGLEPYLLRPKSYFLQRLGPAIGEMMVRLGALGLAGFAVMAAMGRPLPPFPALLALLLLGFLGGVIGTLLYALVGLTAFWLRRVVAPMLIAQKPAFLLGGLVAPISLYPDWLCEIAKVTPFGAHLYWVAVQSLTPSVTLVWMGIGWQVIWILILGGMCGLVWQAGLRMVLNEGV